MLTDPRARDRFVAEWRSNQAEPQRIARFTRHAMDILVDATNDAMTSESFLVLSEDERHLYLQFVAENLGELLNRVLPYWLLSECPTIEDWQKATRDPRLCAVDEVQSQDGLQGCNR
jgi:hypothetical protein